jgi:hypothetical protein
MHYEVEIGRRDMNSSDGLRWTGCRELTKEPEPRFGTEELALQYAEDSRLGTAFRAVRVEDHGARTPLRAIGRPQRRTGAMPISH